MRVGVVGGTFDPVHLGHLVMGEEARDQLELDQVLFLPAGQPWMKEGRPLSAAEHRVEMLKLATASNPYFQVCLDEVNRPGPTYTVDTLEALLAKLGAETALFFIVGQDAMREFHRWKEPDKLLNLCHLVVVERPGYGELDLAELAVRFPAARERVQAFAMPGDGHKRHGGPAAGSGGSFPALPGPGCCGRKHRDPGPIPGSMIAKFQGERVCTVVVERSGQVARITNIMKPRLFFWGHLYDDIFDVGILRFRRHGALAMYTSEA